MDQGKDLLQQEEVEVVGKLGFGDGKENAQHESWAS